MSGVAAPNFEYDLLDPEILSDPYPLYTELRAGGRLHWSDSLEGWAVTHYEDVHRALNAADLSIERYRPNLEATRAGSNPDPAEVAFYEDLQEWFTHADPPRHTRLRGITRTVISPPMKAMGPNVDRLITELLDQAAEEGTTDVVRSLARPLSVGAVVYLLGIPAADREPFTDWSEKLTEFIGGAINVPDRRERAKSALAEMKVYLRDLVAERRLNPTDDLIGRLVGAEANGDRLTDEEIAATSAMLLFAGHGTTTNLIGNGLLALFRNPDQMAALRSGAVTSENAVEEFLRYDSPVQITVRTAAQDGALGYEQIKAGNASFSSSPPRTVTRASVSGPTCWTSPARKCST